MYNNICPSLIKIESKTAEKNSAQTNKQTDRHYEKWSLGREPKNPITGVS